MPILSLGAGVTRLRRCESGRRARITLQTRDKLHQPFQTPNARHDTAVQVDQETQNEPYRCFG